MLTRGPWVGALAPWLILSLLVTVGWAEEEEESRSVEVGRWLQLDATTLLMPAFHGEEGKELKLSDLLSTQPLPPEDLWPDAGDELVWPHGASSWWRETDGAQLDFGERKDGGAALAYAAFYVSTDRFCKATLELSSPQLLQIFVDGEKKAEKKKADAPAKDAEDPTSQDAEEGGEGSGQAKEPEPTTAELILTTGKHLVLVKSLADPEAAGPWTLSASLTLEGEHHEAGLQVELSPRHPLRLEDLLKPRSVASVELSADGDLLALRYREPAVPTAGRESWVEIVNANDGSLLRSFRGMGEVSGFAWAPQGRGFAFTTSDDGKSTLWLADLESGGSRALLEDVEHFGGFDWVPDGKSLVYTLSEEAEEKHEDFKRYRNLADRWTGWRDKSHLYQLSVADGTARRLTAGSASTELGDIAPDGKKLLFTRTHYDTTVRPFYRVELFELDLQSLEPRLLKEFHWGPNVRYSPDGRQLLVLAGPSAFGTLGVTTPEDVMPNEYDTQAYIMDMESLEVTAISRDFDPSIRNAEWSTKERALFVQATDGEFVKLYRYDLRKAEYRELEADVDVVNGFDLSRDGSRLAWRGSSADGPMKVLTAKPGRASKLIAEPGDERYAHIELGQVRGFDFAKSDGTVIRGRVHYPPGFDEKRSYPAIVYYYGGTSTVTRDFGGRYPKNWWAAHGYVVYVLQPSGAVGFGQEFSARHVNEWGVTVVDEIIDGTERFLAAHPFVDRERVGCIGASYGGFMTMLLITHTDLFAGAVSHAGISALSSYWGEGWWGAIYSAVATAEAYPWNATDFYVKQSALYNADKIHTPLLLLHGADDPNVPPGESEQLYTALQVLGREVEYIRIDGEQHWILRYPRRKLWSESIVSWFDRTLKGDERWWQEQWGEAKKDQ